VTINASSGQDFSVNLGPVAPGVDLIRGWVWARTTVDGQSVTFASAHTEANLAGAPPGLLEQISRRAGGGDGRHIGFERPRRVDG